MHYKRELGEDELSANCVPQKLTSAPGKALSASAAKLRLLKKLHCTLKFEKKASQLGARFIAGVDEVGRGSLFGPVVAAAVILDPEYRVRGLRDSKLLPPERRTILAERIREHALAWAVAAVDAARIDQINIYQASRLAMHQAVFGLDPGADHLLVDAMRLDCEVPQQPIIHGDALSASIAAASILAKVERDRMIVEWDPVFPVYGLASNKGYSTPRHLAALREHGPSPLHRLSFAPVWNAPVPQDVLAFMLEEDEEFDSADLRQA
ncbi:MAG: ribonuclease HII [Terriglobales bacterium]